jgi:hypothetical protein
MMIYQTQGISFPRSGHAVVWHALHHYFNKPMNTYGSVLETPDYIWAKQHDFQGDFPKIHWLPHVIQYRNPVRSIVSNYHLHANHTKQDNAEHWQRFVDNQIKGWRRFADKWLINNNIHKHLLVPYEQLVAHPLETLRQIFAFVTDEPIDDSRIRILGIQPRNSLDNFKYYDEGVFSRIESELHVEMTILSLPSYRHSI